MPTSEVGFLGAHKQYWPYEPSMPPWFTQALVVAEPGSKYLSSQFPTTKTMPTAYQYTTSSTTHNVSRQSAITSVENRVTTFNSPSTMLPINGCRTCVRSVDERCEQYSDTALTAETWTHGGWDGLTPATVACRNLLNQNIHCTGKWKKHCTFVDVDRNEKDFDADTKNLRVFVKIMKTTQVWAFSSTRQKTVMKIMWAMKMITQKLYIYTGRFDIPKITEDINQYITFC